MPDDENIRPIFKIDAEVQNIELEPDEKMVQNLEKLKPYLISQKFDGD